MTMEPEGTIPETDVAALMVQLWRERFTGALRFENDSIIKIVYFKEGELLSASTNDSEDSFGEILLKGEKLSREHLKQAMSKRKDDESIADTLLALGFISRKEVTWARRTQLVGVIRSVLNWTAGGYSVVSDYLPKRQEGTSFEFPRVLLEVLLTATDRERFDKAFEGGETVLERIPTFESEYSALGLNEEADEICALVDGSCNVRAIAEASPADSFNVVKLLFALEALGLLTRSGEQAAEVPAIFSEISPSEGDEWAAVELDDREVEPTGLETGEIDDQTDQAFMRAKPKSRVPGFLLIVLAVILIGIGIFAGRGFFDADIPAITPETSVRDSAATGRPAVAVTPIIGSEPSSPGEIELQEVPMLVPVATPTPELTPEAIVESTPVAPPEAAPSPSPAATVAPVAEGGSSAPDPVRARYDLMAGEFQNRMAEKPYSIQFAILCQTSSVTNAMKVDASNVWFVPVRFREQPCYRAFWGRYDDRESAENALSSMPESLRQGSAAVVQTR